MASTINNYESFKEAHNFNLGTLNIGGSPAPPQHTPIHDPWGAMHQPNPALNGGYGAMSQSGFPFNVGGTPGNAYQSPPPSGFATPALQSPQSARPQVQDSSRFESHARPSTSFSSPDLPEGRHGRPSSIHSARLPTPPSSIRSPSKIIVHDDGTPEFPEEREGGEIPPTSPHVNPSPSGPSPRLRHTVFVANGAKMALENASMTDIQRLFGNAGLKNSEWIVQAGYNEEELHDRGRYEEAVVFTILNPAVSVKSIDRKKLKKLFPKYPVIVRSHSGEDQYLERGGKSPAVKNPAHQYEADLLEGLATRTASVSANLPRSLDQASIDFTAKVGLAGLTNPDAHLKINATLAHKESTGDNHDPQRNLEFSKLSFEASSGETQFFHRFSHVLVIYGEQSITVVKPAEISSTMDSFKESTASRTIQSTTYGAGAVLSGSPGVTAQISRTNGRDVQISRERNMPNRYIKTENLDPGVKVKYQSNITADLHDEKFDLADRDKLPIFSMPIPSSSSSSSRTPSNAGDDIVRVRLTCLWTYKRGKEDISEPEQLGALKRLWRWVTAWRSEEGSSPRVAPAYNNVVHCVDLELSTESWGLVRNWQVEPPKPVDMNLDI